LAIRRLFVDRAVARHPRTEAIRSRLRLPAEPVSDPREVYQSVSAADDPAARGKSVLYLTRNKGPFIRKCPGTRSYTCCDYYILHIGTYCVMDCAYCILQAYFHPPVLQFFVNLEEMTAALDRLFRGDPPVRRIGTGEFTDSMIWEPWTGLSELLVPRFGRQSRTVLELKTKTTAVDALEGLDHDRKTIMAWSLNTERVIRSEERGTASLSARLAAAARCGEWGYPLAFHFDPMVIYDGCEAEYDAVAARLFDSVSPDNVVWISLGTFRFMPALKPVIQQRFPDSRIVYGEFITGLDGKMRYFKPLRIALYRKMAEAIRRRAPNVTVYFCMEDDEVWKKALGFTPEERGGLPGMLDEAAFRCCGLEKRH